MTNPDNILRSRDITLPIKFHPVKAVVFPVVIDVRVGVSRNVRVGVSRNLRAEELMLLHCGVGKDS